MKLKMTKKQLALAVILLASALVGSYYWYSQQSKNESAVITQSTLIEYRVDELSQFDGSDPSKPIYIGLNGLVYDVSAGRNYYETNGSYHYLAGKDSSNDLNMIGGDIIKRKYPVVGKLKP